MTAPTKRCTVCHRDLPLDAFGVMSAAPDGKNYRCRECDRANPSKRSPAAKSANVLRNRAAHHASTELKRRHLAEWQAIYDEAYAAVVVEAERLDRERAERERARPTPAAPPSGPTPRPHTPPPVDEGHTTRLRPGPRVDGLPRPDLQWCAKCRDYHNNDHHAPPAPATVDDVLVVATAAAHVAAAMPAELDRKMRPLLADPLPEPRRRTSTSPEVRRVLDLDSRGTNTAEIARLCQMTQSRVNSILDAHAGLAPATTPSEPADG